MSLHFTCLEDFIEVVPVFTQTQRLEVVLEIFSQGEYDRLIIVNEQQQPIGLVSLPNLLPYLLTELPNADLSAGRLPAIDPQQALSDLQPSILEPVTVLPASFTLAQARKYLEQPKLTLALVNALGQCLGLLNPRTLLRFLKNESLPPPSETTVVSETYWHTIRPEANFKPHSATLSPLIQLLEQLPLPLMLQTSTGQAITQNSAWGKQVGEILDPTWVGQDAADQFLLPPLNPPPELASTSRPSLCHLGSEPDTCICTCPMKDGQERALQFVKIPLGEAFSVSALDLPGSWFYLNQRMEEVEAEHFRLASLTLDRDTPRGGVETTASAIRALHPNPSRSNSFTLDALEMAAQSASQTLWLVLAQDVTEQQHLARELTAKNADLIQLNRLKDEFLACISHELKTPLTAVLGLSSLLKDRALGELNDRQIRYARLIYQSGRHLMTVVNDILDLTRMETGQLELMLESVDIAHICDRALEQARHLKEMEEKPDVKEERLADPASTPFALEIEPGLESLIADDLRLRQMLVNLLSNALKFTEAGGKIGLKVNRWAGWIAFMVWDTGIGIPTEKQHLIFQKFQQLENPLTRRFEGTGLGLVLTQRLARLHGGDITFISKEGQGSQFTLLLPPIPPQQQGERQDEGRSNSSLVSRPSSLSSRLVLIVESATRFVEQLTDQLINLGYLVVIARSGTEALEKARNLQPCIIFLNPLLPLLSGWDVLTLLKSDLETRHIPAVVVATRVEKQQAQENRADGFLSLPVQAEALQQILDEVTPRSQTSPGEATSVNLTILRLSVGAVPNQALETTNSLSQTAFPSATDLNSLLHSHRYRVLEADDLEQADLLARVWKPKIILLDGIVSDPSVYLEHLSQYAFLASLPLITLDRAMTQAANQVAGLSVFPCLANPMIGTMARGSDSALLQVIQVAAGFAWKPLILAVDIAGLSDLGEPDLSKVDADDLVAIPPPPIVHLSAGSDLAPSEAETITAFRDTPLQTEWLRALMQYVQTAGYRGLTAQSWTEVLRQLQHQSVDLLLICWDDLSDNSTAVQAIAKLQHLSTKPPILLLHHPWHSSNGSDRPETPNIPPAIQAIATQILPSSLPVPNLLEHIKKALRDCRG